MEKAARILEFISPSGSNGSREIKEGPDSVEIINVFDPDKPPKVLVRCQLIDGEVHFEGDENFIKSLLREDFSFGGKLVSPKDGRIFLDALKAKYRNPYLFGREIKKE